MNLNAHPMIGELLTDDSRSPHETVSNVWRRMNAGKSPNEAEKVEIMRHAMRVADELFAIAYAKAGGSFFAARSLPVRARFDSMDLACLPASRIRACGELAWKNLDARLAGPGEPTGTEE